MEYRYHQGNLLDNIYLINNITKSDLEIDRFDNINYHESLFDFKDKLLSLKDKKLAVAHSTSELLADLLDLSVMYVDNYKEILYDLTEIYYEYNKYMFDNGNDIDIEDEHILKSIDNDLNTFLVQIEGNEKVLEKLSNAFYKYISLTNLDKDKIKHYYDNLCKNGKVKVFNKKKRGSNT